MFKMYHQFCWGRQDQNMLDRLVNYLDRSYILFNCTTAKLDIFTWIWSGGCVRFFDTDTFLHTGLRLVCHSI